MRTAFACSQSRWISDQASVDAAIATIMADSDHLDVVVHNAGHMVVGPTEAFTPEQLAEIYDDNVPSTQRVNRAVLPHLRAQGDGLLISVGSSSSRGGTPSYLAPYVAAKAGQDALAVSRRRAHALRHRDHDHRPRLVHERHEPSRESRDRA
jgi:NAD(P)-dependent dehydrogenase (short-subunit alcohol dehydrogenase family)